MKLKLAMRLLITLPLSPQCWNNGHAYLADPAQKACHKAGSKYKKIKKGKEKKKNQCVQCLISATNKAPSWGFQSVKIKKPVNLEMTS